VNNSWRDDPDGWSPCDDGRRGVLPEQSDSVAGKITRFLVWLPDRVFVMTIRQQWGGRWTIDPIPEREDDGDGA
jgi:hypothetical protein